MNRDAAAAANSLRTAGLEEASVAAWIASTPPDTADYDADRRRFGRCWTLAAELMGRLPQKPKRSEAEAAAAQSLLAATRAQELAQALLVDNPLAAFGGRPLPYVPELADVGEDGSASRVPGRRKRFWFF